MNFTDAKTFPWIKSVPEFYQDVILSFNSCKANKEIDKRQDILDSVVWGNKYFKYNLKQSQMTLFNQDWITSGFTCLKDFKITSGKIDHNYIRSHIIKKPSVLSDLHKISTAFKPYCDLVRENFPQKDKNKPFSTLLTPLNIFGTNLDIYQLKSNYFYTELITQKFEVPKYELFWKTLFKDHNITINFGKTYTKHIKLIKEKKLSEFQFKFVNKILVSHVNLKQWKISESDQCLHCNVEGNIAHILFTCRNSLPLWSRLIEKHYIPVKITEYFENNLIFHIFFNNNFSYAKMFVLTLLSFIIYKEWLDRNYNNKNMMDLIQYTNCVKNNLKFKILCYKNIKWIDVELEIVKLIALLHSK